MDLSDSIEIENASLPNGTALELPTAEALDYAEIFLMVFMIIIGAPINISTFIHTMNLCKSTRCCTKAKKQLQKSTRKPKTSNNNQKQNRPKKSSSSSRSTLLKLHLTAANMFIILVYGISQISWLATYSWRGGDFMCRLIKFFDTFCFYATSNIVVLIAIERVSVAIFVDQPRIVSKYKEKLRIAVWIPWILAVLCSLPQLYIWRIFSPYGEQFPDWKQCITFWMALRVEASAEQANGTYLATINFQETLYSGFHLVLVFWVPALIVLVSYAVILIRFQQHIRKSTREARRNQCAVNAATFRKRAASYHRSVTGFSSPPPSVCEAESTTTSITHHTDAIKLHPSTSSQRLVPKKTVSTTTSCTPTRTSTTTTSTTAMSMVSDDPQGGAASSCGFMLEVPIVLNISQILVFQPTFTNVAVQTLTRAKRKTIKTTAWVLFAYIACWAPYNILELWRYLDPSMDNRYLELLSNLIVLNAVVNPLIYRM